LVPNRVGQIVEQIEAELEKGVEEHSTLFAHVSDCAARTRVYAELLTDRG